MQFVFELKKVAETPQASVILSQEETALYNAFKLEKRRTEWLAGRYAAKEAAAKLCATGSLKEIEIFNDGDRKPYIVLKSGKSPLPVSISHCGEYAAAALGVSGARGVGIDIEKVEQRPRSWAEQSFTAEELAQAVSAPEQTALWTRKEAVLKALGLGLSADLMELDCRGERPVFKGRLKQIWEERGGLAVQVITSGSPAGYMTSIAIQ